MNPILRNVLAVIGGAIVGIVVNMGLIIISSSVIPLPEGVDPTSAESLKENIHLFETKHFIFPFLAHALGTLAGAYVASRFGANKHLLLAMIIGAFFLLGGILNATSIPAPTWFIVVDLVAAYILMAWLGYRLSGKKG